MTTAAPNVRPVRIEEEMRSAYLDYAMSVIVARALPDVRDGLKPVQRRILYAMHELSLRPNSAYKKCARIVGEVLGKYHPHGDAPVYDALVRMAQDFTMRYALVDGQGNFGSVDNDPPAAMRYTEARLAAISEEILVDIEKETVGFAPNFDSSLEEPLVLPARLPNLLVNGAAGIAVGMATSIPPHNLGEVCDGIVHLIDSPEATVEELVQHVKGPDFPTAATIMGRSGIQQAYATGHGRVLVRGRAEIVEEHKGRKAIVVTEIPYQINKAALVEKIADLVKEKRIDGISEVRDESGREGMRVVVELKREAQPEQVLNNLYKHTAMQSAFFINMLALVDGTPRVLNLRQLLQNYVDFRQEVVRKRSEYELKKARERAHILEGLLKALDKIDAVIRTIRESADVEVARANLMQRFALSQVQAQAILDMQLRRLAALEWRKIQDEYATLRQTIAELEALLADAKKILARVREEVVELKKDYGDKRRTEITEEEVKEFRVEDLIPHQDVVITLSNRGYIKRLPITTFRLQHRGGRGIIGTVAREQDAIQHLEVADTHDVVLFFTNRGRVFRLKCFEVPAELSRTAKGVPLVNMIKLEEQERVTAVIAVPPDELGVALPGKDGAETPATPPVETLAPPAPPSPDERCILFCTRRGEIKKSPLSRFRNIRGSGLIAMNLEKGDELVAVKLGKADDALIIVTERGQSIHFSASEVRARSRQAGGIRGIRLQPGDRVVGMDIIHPDSYLFTVSLKGYGKLTALNRYRPQRRGGKGLRTFRVTDKTGRVGTGLVVQPGHDIMLISEKGIVIRTTLDEISVQGRITQGVTVMRLEPGDVVASVAYVNHRASTQEPPGGGKKGRARDGARGAEAEEEPGPEAEADEEAPKARGRRGPPKAGKGATAKASAKRAPQARSPKASAKATPRLKRAKAAPQGKAPRKARGAGAPPARAPKASGRGAARRGTSGRVPPVQLPLLARAARASAKATPKGKAPRKTQGARPPPRARKK